MNQTEKIGDVIGRISGIKRMEIHDGDGIRSTVFLKGCPLHCLWCHNPEGISFTPQVAWFSQKCIACGSCDAVCPVNTSDEKSIHLGKINSDTCTGCLKCADICPTEALVSYGQEISASDLVEKLLQDAPYFIESHGGVTLSGGECLAQPDFAIAIAQKLYEKGISVDIDTCGFVPWQTLERILPFTDTFLFDVKAMDSDLHKVLTGQPNEQILSNLQKLSESGAKIEIRYPLVMGKNDGEWKKIGAFLATLPRLTGVKVLPYHPFAGSRYEALQKENTLPAETSVPKKEDLKRIQDGLRSFGLQIIE